MSVLPVFLYYNAAQRYVNALVCASSQISSGAVTLALDNHQNTYLLQLSL